MTEKKIRLTISDYLNGLCNTYYVLDELGYPTNTELYELLYLFKKECEWKADSETIDTLTKLVEDFIDKQEFTY